MDCRSPSSLRQRGSTPWACVASPCTSTIVFSCSQAGDGPAVPRHQSLRATLEWSHQLLSRSERAVFRRLAIFADGFTLAAAGAIAASAEIGAPEVVECVANLVAKSIVAADVDRAVPSYRLLETTRAYALEKLHESGEFEQVQHRHAAYFEGSLQSGRMK
jgi:predicted ATPase